MASSRLTRSNELCVRFVVFMLLGLLAVLAMPQLALAQSGACTSSSNAGYTVTVCITQPGNGATVSGLAPVTATVSVSGTSSGVGKLVFTLDGQYLLTDFEAPYTFSLPTTSFANGAHTLAASPNMRDGFPATAAAVTLTFSNASTPTPGPVFTPVAPGAPPAGQALIMGAVGDGASGEANAALVAGMVDGWNPNLFLYLGDVYEKGTYTEFYNWYGTASVDFGKFRDVTNPAIGNHEYDNGVAPGYFAYWNNVPNYYSYNAGGWHFIALNSTSQFNQTGTNSAQYQWLVNDLNSNTAACSIVYFHHPVLSVGPQGDTTRMNAMWSLMVQKGVDMVLTGHDHSYQRWAPLDANLNPSAGGVTSFVAGAGGHGVQDAVRTDARLAVMYGNPVNAFGAMYFKLNPKGAEYRYVNTAGQTLDQGVVACSGTSDTSAPNAPAGLTAATSTSGHVALSWTASWDDTGVNGYGIYRDGALLTTVGGATTQYVDTNVGLNVTYNYQVDAMDLGGRRSAKSNTASITRGSTATLTFTSTADAYVRSDFATTNFGSAVALLTDASPDIQSFLRFNLQGVNGTVTSATLRMWATNGSSIGYQVYPLTSGTWDESTVTYATRPGSGSQAATSGSFGSGVWAPANLTSLVSGNGQLDIALKSTSSTQINMNSREGANPPQLVVNISDSTPSTATPTFTPTSTPTNTPAAVPSDTPTNTPAAVPSDTPTNAPTAVASDTPTPTSTPAAVASDTPTPTDTPAAVPSDTPTPTPTPTATNTPTATPTPTASGPLTFTSVADAYVDSSQPTLNFGTGMTLRTDGSPDVRSFLRFNVQGLAGPVSSATLRIWANSAQSTGYSIYPATGSWTETGVNWNNKPTPGALVGASGAVSLGTWTQVNVTAAIAGNGTFDFVLSTTNATALSLASRESGANAPQLVIQTGAAAAPAGAAAAAPALSRSKPSPSRLTPYAEQPTTDLSVDTDDDGVPDIEEVLNGTDIHSADTDGDGLPDLWEIESGLAPSSADGDQGAIGDPDHDGATNLQEYWANTDPFDAASHP